MGADDQTQMEKGTRIFVEEQAFGVGYIAGWRRHKLEPVAANYHTVVFDGCVSCVDAGGCDACRKELQLKGTKWRRLERDPGVTTGVGLASIGDDDYAMAQGEAQVKGARAGMAGGVAVGVATLDPAAVVVCAAIPVALAVHNLVKTATGGGVNLRVGVGQAPNAAAARELEAIGIRNFTLQRNTSLSMFAYQLKFENQRLGSFAFTDETGDVYKVTAFRKKTYSIAYNSRAPTIVNVKSF